MAVEKMKVKPSCKRLIRSISSWMPRSNRSGSAKSGPRRSRNTLLTMLAAGIESIVCRAQIHGNHHPQPTAVVVDILPHAPFGQSPGTGRGPTGRWRSLPGASPPFACRQWPPDRRGNAPSPGRFSATGSRRDRRDGESAGRACASGIAGRREGPRAACGAMRSSFLRVKPNRPRPANLPGSSVGKPGPVRRSAIGHGIGDQQLPEEQGESRPVAAGVVKLDGQVGVRRLGADVETNADLPPQIQSRGRGQRAADRSDSHLIAGAGLSTVDHRSRPPAACFDLWRPTRG